MKKSWLLDFLFPPKCVFCQGLLQEQEEHICKACLSTLPENPETRPVPFTKGCRAPLRYSGTVREAMLRFKFGSRPYYAEVFGPMIAAKLSDCAADFVTWVPVSARRRFSRGYDQAQLLAESAAKELGLPCIPTLRKRHTKKQSRLSDFSARKANISGSLSVIDRKTVEGKTIILIDDICTTGATMSEAAYVLHLAGAAAIHGAVYAIAKNR